ncbi:MAG TPA: TonB-dependent receptor [Sphingopyxis sp.]|uniref:TonB-dependent receptor n=1 Tax=Sphingopyxis sp. TaxID=1908224 RepID=UPI002BA24BDF|nr:TonB-dependent receptor [Sphingopyxis sp.]HWW57615.1 TonB-dependent receptor [Sphingopyxis sp.]
MTMTTRKSYAMQLLSGVALTGAIAMAGPALAQTSGAQAPAATDGSGPQIDDIVVTARKREESLQNVPIAITAYSGDAIREAQIASLSEFAGRTPGFTFQQQSSLEQEAFIRGVGTLRLNSATADPSIGLFLNEVYIGRRGAATPPIFDLERVEVLRGPQGTIFGKNVVGGAVSLVTAAPQFTTGAGGYLAIGNYDTVQSEAYVTGPVSEKIAIRAAGYVNRHSGFSRNIVTGQELEDMKSVGGRISVLAEPTDALKISIVADISRDRSGGQARHAVDDPTRAGIGPITTGQISSDPRTTETPYDQYSRRNTRGISGRIDHDMGFGTLTYLSALRIGKSAQRYSQAGAGSPPSFTDSVLTQEEDYSGLTQELRLASDGSGRVNWITGIYYLREKTDRSSRNTATSFLPGGPGSTRDSLDGDNIFEQVGIAKNYAVFGELSFDLTSQLTLSAGARYTIDKKSMVGGARVLSLGQPGDLLSPAPLQAPYSLDVDKTWREFTPRVAIEYKINQNILVYASAARGFKGGGWQSAAPDLATAIRAFNPETAWSYEVGFKSDLFDRRVRLNLAAFQLDFKDLQVEQLDDVLLTTVVANAANAKIRGLEGEVTLAVTDGLTLSGSGSVIDAKYLDYVDVGRGLDFTGNKLPRAADYQFSVAADYETPVSGKLTLKAHVDYVYQDSIFYGPDNTNREPGYGQLNARLGIGAIDDRWTISLWGKNLTNKLYRVSVIPFLGDEASLYGAPRTYGVRVSGKF